MSLCDYGLMLFWSSNQEVLGKVHNPTIIENLFPNCNSVKILNNGLVFINFSHAKDMLRYYTPQGYHTIQNLHYFVNKKKATRILLNNNVEHLFDVLQNYILKFKYDLIPEYPKVGQIVLNFLYKHQAEDFINNRLASIPQNKTIIYDWNSNKVVNSICHKKRKTMSDENSQLYPDFIPLEPLKSTNNENTNKSEICLPELKTCDVKLEIISCDKQLNSILQMTQLRVDDNKIEKDIDVNKMCKIRKKLFKISSVFDEIKEIML